VQEEAMKRIIASIAVGSLVAFEACSSATPEQLESTQQVEQRVTDTDVVAPYQFCNTYEDNRLQDPWVGVCCTTTDGLAGTLQQIGNGLLGCMVQSAVPPCVPNAVLVPPGTITFDTTGPYCLKINGPLTGWGCTNIDGRTLQVNDIPVSSCGGMPLPALFNGAEYFEFTAGSISYASLYAW
jgi:hypothetical protein